MLNTDRTRGLRALLLVVVLSWLLVALLVRGLWYVIR
jgi:hypothetical protein